jgi:hypothetical protein
LAKKPELGGACISLRSESQYLEFSMAASVQGCEKSSQFDMGWPDLLVSDAMVMMAADDCRG